MTFPTPKAGMVIRYSYLWRSEKVLGREEGHKDRPCTILLAVASGAQVIVLPIPHTPPAEPSSAIEIPPATKHRLRLDEERSWIVLTEANRFTWPGPDLRPLKSGDPESVVYGQLPADLFRKIQEAWLALAPKHRSLVTRTD